MKAIGRLSVAGIMAMLTSCFLEGIKLCPKDENRGRLKLTNPTFSPYQGNEVLKFTNQSGHLLTLTNFEYDVLSTHQRLIMSTPCYKSDFVKQQIYYEIPRLYVSYRQNKSDHLSTIMYSFGIQDLRLDHSSNDTLLAEDLTIINNFTKPSTTLRILVSDRGNQARFDPIKSQYPRLINYRMISDTVLGGHSYKQVYCSKELPSLFFTRQEGIVAFKDDKEWWYLR